MDAFKTIASGIGDAVAPLETGAIKGISYLYNRFKPKESTTTPTVAPIQAPTPVIPNTPKLTPIVAPIVPPVTQEPFTIDTKNATSDHVSGDSTPATVISNANAQAQTNVPSPYANSLSLYQSQAPSASDYSNATAFSPEQMKANANVLSQNQIARQMQENYLGGVQNVMDRPEALDFQQGQQASLQRQNALMSGQQALNQQAATEQAGYLENVRQNNIAAVQAQQTGAQNQFQNSFNATQGGLNYGIQQGQLGIQQQQANQGRYSYQQITDPNTGFPTIQVIDNQSGLPVGNVAPGSTAGQNIINSGGLNGGQNTSTGTGTGTGTIGGYDLSNYATDPTHNQQVTGWYNAINQATQGVGGITNANTAQAVINQLSQNSPVTGTMLMNAAQKANVDPALMISLMQQESMLGASNVAQKDNNFGGITWSQAYQDAHPGASKGSARPASEGGNYVKFATPQDGVSAMAENLASRKIDTQVTATGQSTYESIVKQAPPQLANSIKPLPDGSAYIDSSLLANPQFGVMAQNFANKYGVRVLNASDATALNTVTQSINNMQTLANTFGNLAAKTAVGGKLRNITDPINLLADTDYGSQLAAYQANREGLFQQIRALAGSSPRLNGQELITAANSMPSLSEFNKDTLKDGINKLVKTQSYLDNAIRTLIPNYTGTPVTINGQYAALGKDGVAYMFPSNDAALQFMKTQK